MALYKVPVTKGKGFVEVDSAALPQDVYTYCFLLGAKSLVNRMAKVVRSAYDSEDELREAAMAKALENVEAMLAGKVRMVGFKATKTPGKVMTEARRIAREIVKQQIRDAGEKLSEYDAKDITEAANALIAANEEIIKEAEQNLAERETKASKLKVDVSGIKKSPKKVAKLAAEAAARKEVLSKAQQSGQGGRPAVTRTRPSA